MNLEQDKKRADKLCIVSLVCVLLPAILTYVFVNITGLYSGIKADIGPDGMNLFSNIWGLLSVLLFIAGITLLIYVRVKYPKNTFGKVLMWVYIVMAILLLITFMVALLVCYTSAVACGESTYSCLQDCKRLE